MTRLVVLAATALFMGCTMPEGSERRLTRMDERAAKGIGMVLYTPQPVMFGPQRIVVALTVATRKDMANVSAVWLTYTLPSSGIQHTVRMRPVGDYLDAFGAVVPFIEAGLWDMNIHVYRGGVPARATFRVLCCRSYPTTIHRQS